MSQLYESPYFAGLFLFLGAVLLFLEVFIPSGGILGILAFASAAFGIFGFFWQDNIALAGVSIFSFLVYGGLMIYWIMRRVTFAGHLESSTDPLDTRLSSDLVGRTGTSTTPLRPAGVALIGDAKVDVVTQGGFIDKGTPVVVVEISGNRVVVRRKGTPSATLADNTEKESDAS